MQNEEQQQQESEDQESQQPANRIEIDQAEPPYYTIAIVVAFAIVFIVQMQSGLEETLDRAAFIKPLFIENREYWRILTGAALHLGVLHVLFNGYALYSFGRISEMLSNRANVAIVFLLAAVGGGLLSLVMKPDGSSVGASGGVVGIIGYLLVYSFRRRQFISPEFRKSLLINIGFITLYGLLLYQVIDNYGHLGGLIAGAGYALFQVPSDPSVDPREAGPITEYAGVLCLAIYIGVCGITIMKLTGVA